MKKRKIRNKSSMKNYGEFISSFFGWIEPGMQKQRADELNNMTKKQEKNRKSEFE